VALSKRTIGENMRRAFLYLGLASASLIGIGLLVAFSVRTGIALTGGWIGLAGYTGLLFWVVIRRSRERWHRPAFWFVVVSLLAVHLLAFAAVLRSYPAWPMIWFLPIVIVEAALFSVVLDMLLGSAPKGSRESRRPVRAGQPRDNAKD
jgi:hypothetical protein